MTVFSEQEQAIVPTDILNATHDLPEEHRREELRFFRDMQCHPPIFRFPVYQEHTVVRTFSPHRKELIGHPMTFHEQAICSLSKELRQQLQAIDYFYQWLLNGGYRTSSYKDALFAYRVHHWLLQDRYPRPFGDFGFREVHRQVQNSRNTNDAKTQLLYRFFAGRKTLYQPTREKLCITFRLPRTMDVTKDAELVLDRSLSNMVVGLHSVKMVALLNPQGNSLAGFADDGRWHAFVAYSRIGE